MHILLGRGKVWNSNRDSLTQHDRLPYCGKDRTSEWGINSIVFHFSRRSHGWEHMTYLARPREPNDLTDATLGPASSLLDLRAYILNQEDRGSLDMIGINKESKSGMPLETASKPALKPDVTMVKFLKPEKIKRFP